MVAEAGRACARFTDARLHNYLCDSHNHGGIWGVPIVVLDTYEHAYFIDYGSTKTYIEDYMKI